MGSSESSNVTYNVSAGKEKEKKNQSGPYCNVKVGDYENFFKNNKDVNMLDFIIKSFKENAKEKCMGYREASFNGKEVEFLGAYKTVSFGEVWNMAETLSKVIEKEGFSPNTTYEKDDHYDGENGQFKMMGLFAKNCVEWLCIDLACQLNSTTTATFYSTLGDDSFEHIFNQTRLTTICITPENIKTLIKYHEKYKFRTLRNVILFDLTQYNTKEDNTLLEEKMKGFGIQTYYFSKLISTNQEELKNVQTTRSNADSLLTICYTSGTTNLPKGVKLTQRNFGSQWKTLEDADYSIGPSDVHFSYLPLAHVMERSIILINFIYGACSYFISGEPRKYLAPEIAMVRPTYLVTVPRVLAMFRTMILETLGKLQGFKKALADRALATKEANYDYDGNYHHWFYDKYLFKTVRNKFGGRVKFFVTGSAPLAPELSKSIKIFFSCPILEAYGMTETTGGVVASSFLDNRNLNCGGCLRSCNFKLVDVPEMGYSHTDVDPQGRPTPTGEICAKGLNITPGYFRDVKNTEATIDKDGWLHTGDVGKLMAEDQGLRVIDRVKEIFKLAQGEYLAPSKLEGAYALSPYIEQICVHGDSFHTFTVSIIYPNKTNLRNFLVEKGILTSTSKPEDVDKYLNDDLVQNEIRASCDKIAKEKNFNPLEKVGKMILSSEMFTLQNGLLTDTMKMKRKSFQKTFESQINKFYS